MRTKEDLPEVLMGNTGIEALKKLAWEEMCRLWEPCKTHSILVIGPSPAVEIEKLCKIGKRTEVMWEEGRNCRQQMKIRARAGSTLINVLEVGSWTGPNKKYPQIPKLDRPKTQIDFTAA